MASIINFKPLQDNLLFSINLCKCSSAPTIFRFQFSSDVVTFSPPKHNRRPRLFSLTKVSAHVTRMETQSSTVDQELSHSTVNVTGNQIVSGFSSLGIEGKRIRKKSVRRTNLTSVVEKDVEGRFLTKNRRADKRLNSEQRREMDSWNSNLARNRSKTEVDNVIRGRISKISEKGDGNQLGVKNMKKGAKKNKDNSPGTLLRIGLDMCSKRGDVLGAIKLYDLALKESIKMGQYHYAVLLYLCSSAATGVVQPAKSGSGNRSLTTVDSSNEFSVVSFSNFIDVENVGKRNFRSALNMQVSDMENLNGSRKNHENPVKNRFNSNGYAAGVPEDGPDNGVYEKEDIPQFLNGYTETPPRSLDEVIGLMQHGHKLSTKDTSIDHEGYGILVTEDVKKYALEKGFEIYEKMRLEEVPMNEATFTSVARMAKSIGDGDMAFEIVKQMKTLGINPRLRSYGPALSVFCNNGDIERAFIVEKHMLEHGVSPEEPELEALLRVSVEASRSDKVYYLLHKLRTSVRKVSPSTADLIEKWFKSGTASRVGKRKWDPELIKDAIGTGGGGWHGQGWLGKGKWTVLHTSVGSDGLCKCCNEKLATIDLDPIETEKFAESVASIARQRERNSSFQKFQKWLDYYGPFEAVVDGANVGLFSQRRFKPSKVNAVVNGIRQMLPSKKYPLVILHNRRITGDKMDEPFNRTLIEKWKNADALYATPTGSNDDWYWLYAAIKFKCLLVTNDEMRDHLFQLLGNDFFPKWKERHQVHFSFSDVGPVFRMPPPCSVVIQESEKGNWHIPVETECDYEGERMWLCITRGASQREREDSTWALQESPPSSHEDGLASVDARSRFQINLESWKINHEAPNHASRENFRNLKHIFSSSLRADHHTILQDIEAAEKFGHCVIEFQI